MRRYKNCIRCHDKFLATENQLVCDHCYGTTEDIELAHFLNREGEFSFHFKRIIDMIKINSKGGDKWTGRS